MMQRCLARSASLVSRALTGAGARGNRSEVNSFFGAEILIHYLTNMWTFRNEGSMLSDSLHGAEVPHC